MDLVNINQIARAKHNKVCLLFQYIRLTYRTWLIHNYLCRKPIIMVIWMFFSNPITTFSFKNVIIGRTANLKYVFTIIRSIIFSILKKTN